MEDALLVCIAQEGFSFGFTLFEADTEMLTSMIFRDVVPRALAGCGAWAAQLFMCFQTFGQPLPSLADVTTAAGIDQLQKSKRDRLAGCDKHGNLEWPYLLGPRFANAIAGLGSPLVALLIGVHHGNAK